MKGGSLSTLRLQHVDDPPERLIVFSFSESLYYLVGRFFYRTEPQIRVSNAVPNTRKCTQKRGNDFYKHADARYAPTPFHFSNFPIACLANSACPPR